MSKRRFKSENAQPINHELKKLEKVIQKKNELIATEEKIISTIRGGFKKRVVVFIDLVDSTKSKIVNEEEPEKWIMRLQQFAEIIAEYIEECGGKVVKYIGDELMAIFDRETKVDDAINLIMRIKDIERTLYEISNESTKIKISLDYGDVYLMSFEGHKENDPQGTPVDRCARISKYCKPSTILTSFEFVNNCTFTQQWNLRGEIDLKGLGITKIFQFLEDTVQIEETIKISKIELYKKNSEFQTLKSETQDLRINIKDFENRNAELVKLLQEKGKEIPKNLVVNNETSIEKESQEFWDSIVRKISDFRDLIRQAGVAEYEYARFLFLHFRGESDNADPFNGKTFESTLDKDLIEQDSGNLYRLNRSHRRNKKLILMMEEIEDQLQTYETEYRDAEEDKEDLFDYSLKVADFWYEYIGISVV